MVVEDVTRKSFAGRRPSEQQGELPVGNRLLGQVVIDDQRVLAAVPVVLSHGTTRERSKVLQRGRVTGTGRDDNSVVHGAMLSESLHHLGHRGLFLANGNIDADHILALLIDDGIHPDGGLANLAVADDQLTLTPTHRGHGIDGLEPRIHGLVHRLAVNNAGGDPLDSGKLLGLDGTLAIQRLPHSVHDSTDNRIAHRYLGNATGALDLSALFNVDILAHDGATHVVFFQVEGEAIDSAVLRGKLQ